MLIASVLCAKHDVVLQGMSSLDTSIACRLIHTFNVQCCNHFQHALTWLIRSSGLVCDLHCAFLRYLKQADLAECTRQRNLVKRMTDLEATVAQQVGVSMLYSSDQLRMQPKYMQFLERIADGAATAGVARYV